MFSCKSLAYDALIIIADTWTPGLFLQMLEMNIFLFSNTYKN